MLQSSPWFVAGAILLLGSVLIAVVAWRRRRLTARQPLLPDEWPLAPRPVFSAEERQVYRQLREALPQHVVLSKLPLVRFCHPHDPGRIRYWYELIGALNVSFAICTGSGRVLAAIDIESPSLRSRRGQRIKQSVLAACEVRYLRCKADALPTIPELRSLVPPAGAAAPAPSTPTPWPEQRSSGWPESNGFIDSFLTGYRRSNPPPDQNGPPSRNGTTGR